MRGTPTLGGEPTAHRDGVIRLQHQWKISSILIRNTVVPIATPTTLGSCLPIEGVKSPKPGVVMSIIPLDVQRRCERRWASQFSPADGIGIGRTSKPGAGEGTPADRRGRPRAKENPPGRTGGLASADLSPVVIPRTAALFDPL